jgi:hypothetical protein
MVFQKATTIKYALDNTFKEELFYKVFKYVHKRPVIYWMNEIDRFVDNTKDRWRKDQDLQNKEDLLDEFFAELKKFDYWTNDQFYNLGYIDTSDFLNRLKVKNIFTKVKSVIRLKR